MEGTVPEDYGYVKAGRVAGALQESGKDLEERRLESTSETTKEEKTVA